MSNYEFAFKKEYPFDKRTTEAQRIKSKYPDRIPVICEKAPRSTLPDIDKKKYLVPNDLSVSQFMYIIRKRIKLPKEKSLMIFVNGNELIKGETLMNDAYQKYRDEDGFLYVVYADLNVLGA
mmetsp:Transcript_23858/g.27046  ORF Transcript_23858/g.27046 Transcript_23858/m.27046 type:complete len:122 (+) Transcript_23858:127-492(+)|eukprot:CAMPEP_0114994452 /NCGR_PEP_ID=MMETSP0216-20121206/13145_1 /TAXON_ID=223996 /ORGANISM="Protocruzia adherens, Strain Boccale" /LENGTH=121 /DNA_ID=CAMNT_0002358311 /DNA_START=66 /DNA_END=431 /DNA_ORIENTATION=+